MSAAFADLPNLMQHLDNNFKYWKGLDERKLRSLRPPPEWPPWRNTKHRLCSFAFRYTRTNAIYFDHKERRGIMLDNKFNWNEIINTKVIHRNDVYLQI